MTTKTIVEISTKPKIYSALASLRPIRITAEASQMLKIEKLTQGYFIGILHFSSREIGETARAFL